LNYCPKAVFGSGITSMPWSHRVNGRQFRRMFRSGSWSWEQPNPESPAIRHELLRE
jgi:hypothetical protein